MKEIICRTRASVNLRTEPSLKSHIVEALGPNEPVAILEDAGNMLKVHPIRREPPISGFVLKSAIISPKEKPTIFPTLKVAAGEREIPSVPPGLKASELDFWLKAGDIPLQEANVNPPWLVNEILDQQIDWHQSSIGTAIRDAIEDHRATWDTWITKVKVDARLEIATVGEWLIIVEGGQEMWSFRHERIFKLPSEHSAALGWVAPEDILHWTGRVFYNPQEEKYKVWYEVELTKLDREMKGWYKANLLEEYVIPVLDNDPSIQENKDHIFDLSHQLLRIPQDKEIEQAKSEGRNVAQYINLEEVIGWNKIHYNLCGEFCVAALCGMDVIPTLQKWKVSDSRSQKILVKDQGTSIRDLQIILALFGKEPELFRPEPSVAPITPNYMRKMLGKGKMAIVGVGLTRTGLLNTSSKIRHWVVVEDILLVGRSGWVRLYNPFHNREEVYPFHAIFDSSSSVTGFWTEPNRTSKETPLPETQEETQTQVEMLVEESHMQMATEEKREGGQSQAEILVEESLVEGLYDQTEITKEKTHDKEEGTEETPKVNAMNAPKTFWQFLRWFLRLFGKKIR